MKDKDDVVHIYVLSRFPHVWLSATLWTVCHQPPLSWDSPGKNTGVDCYALLHGIFLTQELNLHLLSLPALAGEFFTTSTTWEAPSTYIFSLPPSKEWNFTICSNIVELGGHYVKWSKSNRERQILYYITYMWNLKKDNKPVTITKRFTDLENNLVVTIGEREGRKGYIGIG